MDEWRPEISRKKTRFSMHKPKNIVGHIGGPDVGFDSDTHDNTTRSTNSCLRQNRKENLLIDLHVAKQIKAQFSPIANGKLSLLEHEWLKKQIPRDQGLCMLSLTC